MNHTIKITKHPESDSIRRDFGAMIQDHYASINEICFHNLSPKDVDYNNKMLDHHTVCVWHINPKRRPIPIEWDGAVTASDNA